jgi:O-succinylbenzoate synthase
MALIVRDLTCFRYRIPLVGNVTVLPGQSLESREGVFIRITAESGEIGWGEASPLPGFSRETVDDVGRLGRDLKALVGAAVDVSEPWTIPGVTEDAWPPSLQFGIEGALTNLAARAIGTSEASLLGAEAGATVPVAYLVSGSVEDAVVSASEAMDAGYGCLKLKVGRRAVEHDLDLLRAVHDVMEAGSTIRLDANRAWTLSQASSFVDSVGGLPVEYIEEPLRHVRDLSYLAARTPVPIALDETLREQPADAFAFPGASVHVVKPTLEGGLSSILKRATRCREHGMQLVISSSYETGLGTRLLAALSASVSGELAAGLGTYRYVQDERLGTRFDGFGPEVALQDVPEDLAVDTGLMERLDLS